MRLLRPDLAVWLLAVPAALACWILHYRYKWRLRRRAAEHVPTERGRLSRRTTRMRDAGVLMLSTLAIALLTAAMTRPQVAWERRTPTFERRDLVLILDRSVSMRAQDIFPSRFERAVDEIQTFVRRKPATIDRVALVGFAAASVVLSYPTDDIDSLTFYLDWMREDVNPLYGTDIGGALLNAVALVQRDRQRVPPLFVLISDGDDQGQQLHRATAAVAQARIRVHCIGIGSDEEVPIAAPDAAGEFLRDNTGRVLTTRFEEGTLRQLAAATGGRYFRSMTGGELLSALDSLAVEDRRQVGWASSVDYRDLYLPLLAAAAALSLWLVVLL